MNPTEKPVALSVVVLREEFDNWAVLYNPDTGYAAGTNPVGVAVWKLMDGKKSVADIVAHVKNRFEDAPDAAGKEIIAFVNTLAENGFVGLEPENQ